MNIPTPAEQKSEFEPFNLENQIHPHQEWEFEAPLQTQHVSYFYLQGKP
jgi:hypothetical protein